MKKIICSILLISFSLISFAQEKTLTPLPVSEINILRTKTSGIEMTIYEGTKTISISGIQNSRFVGFAADTLAPEKLNSSNDAYLMVLVNDEFYMDCELSYTSENAYLIFKKDDNTYYNRLSTLGKNYFRQLMQNK